MRGVPQLDRDRYLTPDIVAAKVPASTALAGLAFARA